MTNCCSFVNNLPRYALDRTIVINGNHEHLVSGYKLAKASQTFKSKLIELRKFEVQKFQKENDGGDDDDDNNHVGKDENNIKLDEDTDGDQIDSYLVQTFSSKNVQNDPLIIDYPDMYGLECVLSFIHCEPNIQILTSRLNPTSVKSMLQAGLDFEVNEFVDKCIGLIRKDLNSRNCWRYWKVVEKFELQLPEFKSQILDYILEHFVEASQLDESLHVDYEDLMLFLKQNALNCSDELILFRFIERWLYHSWETRQLHASSLLYCLRLGRILPNKWNEIIESSLVQTNSDLFQSISCEFFDNLSKMYIDNSMETEQFELHHYLNQPRLPHAAIFVVGGWEGNQNDANFGPSKAIQVYNFQANQWTRFENTNCVALNEGHAYSGCVIHDSRIFVVGGYISNGPTQAFKVFELQSSTWKFLSPMHERRNYVCVCLLNHKIYAMGGHNGKHRLNSVESYNIADNYWSFVASMRHVRSDAGADVLCGCIYVVGGFDGHHFYDSVEVYNPQADQWTILAPMSNIRSGVGVIATDRYLFAIGGNDGLQRLRTVERFDPQINQWQLMPSMNCQRSNFCVANLEQVLYVMGGWSDESNSTITLVERWIPNVSQSWEPVHELFMPASANCCCTVEGLSLIKKYLDI